MRILSVLFNVLMLGALLFQVLSEPVEDKLALLDFVNNIQHARDLDWSNSSNVCNWTGIACNSNRSRIISLHLPGYGFTGEIPPNTLSRLTKLQTLSLRSNSISGSFPSDFKNLADLNFLHLQFNRISGALPSDFSVWKSLTYLDLSSNKLSGEIPISISNLTHLRALNLANNSLTGPIPDLDLPNLEQLNLSNNTLDSTVPKSLWRFPPSSFTGNLPSVDSGVPIAQPSPPENSPLPVKKIKARKLSNSTMFAIVVSVCFLGLLGFSLLLILFVSKRKNGEQASGKTQEKSTENGASKDQGENNKLVFFDGCISAFDLEDLLRASAEVLGKGTCGTVYKAVLEDSTTVVVKRLKDLAVGKREFEQQMEVIGKIKHENVVELKVYYYSKEEKLMVYDYYSSGSVSSMLYGIGGEKTRLDWDTRLGIALGAARGLAHIHNENGGKLVHGNIKSSNIFLNSRKDGCVSDVGITTMMHPSSLPSPRLTGYRAPELIDPRKPTQAADVYSFGVFLLELLTGKSPIHVHGSEEVIHLVRWVNSVVREEWTAEVFDLELMRYPNIEEELVEVLQIALTCSVRLPEQRPKMDQVVKMMEDVRRSLSPSARATPVHASTASLYTSNSPN